MHECMFMLCEGVHGWVDQSHLHVWIKSIGVDGSKPFGNARVDESKGGCAHYCAFSFVPLLDSVCSSETTDQKTHQGTLLSLNPQTSIFQRRCSGCDSTLFLGIFDNDERTRANLCVVGTQGSRSCASVFYSDMFI